MNERIKHVLENLPSKPGVYFMKDESGKIIYIGKAKNLKNRVSSYFSSTKKNLKTELLVSNIYSVEYILTASEQDAFSLESNLIKENQPKYNILLKDDKLFPYIRIDKKELFPTINVVRRVKNDGALYFGPYVTGLRVNEIISIIRSVFKLRECSINFEKQKTKRRKCLFGDMGKCSAPCVKEISETDYLKIIDDVIDFLNGKNAEVKRLLTSKMNDCVNNENYEEAIIYRDQIEMLNKSDSYILSNIAKDENFDVFTIGLLDEFICVNIIAVRNGKTVLDKNVGLDAVEVGLEECLEDYLLEYYSVNIMPNEVLVSHELNPILSQILWEQNGKKVDVKVPVKGVKKKILDVAKANVNEYLNKNLDLCKLREQMSFGAVKELAMVLGLESIPTRLECYDISNISGTNSVASMVVFENGKPAKKEYRKFKIKTVEGANDFASIEETLRRRLNRLVDGDEKFSRPDLIVVDGGLGQLNSANKVLKEMNINIPLISLAKEEELIYTTKSNEPIILNERSEARKLIQRLRDEAHRFAITFHREIRNKNMFK